MVDDDATPARPRLNRARVLEAAVELADDVGFDALSMRRLAHELDVVPMALYKHVANKEELLDGMVDVLVAEIAPTPSGLAWRAALRARVLAAREVLLRHGWARQALESRTAPTPAVLDHIDATIGLLRAGGFGDQLTHHVMHALGSRLWGFTQELFEGPGAPAGGAAEGAPDGAPTDPQLLAAMAQRYPNIAAVSAAAQHDDGSVVGRGCDDQAEFEFALDLMLDGFERLAAQGWTPPARRAEP